MPAAALTSGATDPRARARRRRERATSLVEFALVAPIVVFLVFVCIDLGRLVYTYNAISSAARDGARLVALRPQAQSDCVALQRMEQVGQAFPLLPDPHSIADPSVNTDPNNPGTPPAGPSTPSAGVGYVYIWPAAAQATPQDGTNASGGRNCDGINPRGAGAQVKNVEVEIQYVFKPLTPLAGTLFKGGITIRTISVVQTEY